MFCSCKECKKMLRKGKILGTRPKGFWIKGWSTGEYEYYYGNVSDYVPFRKFSRGRSRKDKLKKHRKEIHEWN